MHQETVLSVCSLRLLTVFVCPYLLHPLLLTKELFYDYSIPYLFSIALYSGESLLLMDSDSTSFWIWRMPSSTCSGRGGQPGMYTSTGMILSMPCNTLYVAKIPPLEAHAPMESTYFGSAICS